MEDRLIELKCLTFAVRIVKATRYLKKEKREYDLANQLLRSGTSIGASVVEARYAESDKDFVSKHKIALKEASETQYWLKLLVRSEILSTEETQNLAEDVEELIKILTSIIRTKQANMNKQ